MDVLGVIKVIDKERAKVLEMLQFVFGCDKCTDFDEFTEKHGREICEFLQSTLKGDYSRLNVRYVVEFVEVEECPEELEEPTENEIEIELSGVIKWLA